jgi:hypothetical protein
MMGLVEVVLVAAVLQEATKPAGLYPVLSAVPSDVRRTCIYPVLDV